MDAVTINVPKMVTEPTEFTLPAFFKKGNRYIALFSDRAIEIFGDNIYSEEVSKAIESLEDTFWNLTPFTPTDHDTFEKVLKDTAERILFMYCDSYDNTISQQESNCITTESETK